LVDLAIWQDRVPALRFPTCTSLVKLSYFTICSYALLWSYLRRKSDNYSDFYENMV
jgi:hypothetical protein